MADGVELNIPQDDSCVFRCPACEDSVFIPVQAAQFVRTLELKAPLPGKPTPVMLWKCMTCEGVLMRKKDGTWAVLKRDQKADEKSAPPLMKTLPVVKPAGGGW